MKRAFLLFLITMPVMADIPINYTLSPLLPSTVKTDCFDLTPNPKFAGSGTFRGTAKADLMKGTDPNGAYTFLGLGGADLLCGSSGPSTLNGGPGNDLLIGGPGNDILTGLQGQDTLEGGAGDDYLDGEPGRGVALTADNYLRTGEIFGYQGPDGLGGKRKNYTVYRFSGTGDTGHDTIHNFRAGDVIELVGRDSNQDGVVDPWDLVYIPDPSIVQAGTIRVTLAFTKSPPSIKKYGAGALPQFSAGPTCNPDVTPRVYTGPPRIGELGCIWDWTSDVPTMGNSRGTIRFVWDREQVTDPIETALQIYSHIRYKQ